LGQINALQKTVGEPLQLHVTGVGPKTKKLLDQRFADKWIMHFQESSFDGMFDSEKLVYLSGDAEGTMTDYNPE
jgi:hypothetical protein